MGRVGEVGLRDGSPDYDGQHHWLELDNNITDDYISLFAQEKLFWMDLTDRGRFAYDAGDLFALNTVYVLVGGPVKFLSAVLNSRLVTWFMATTALTSGMGVTRWFSSFVSGIPIPKSSSRQQRPLVRPRRPNPCCKAAGP